MYNGPHNSPNKGEDLQAREIKFSPLILILIASGAGYLGYNAFRDTSKPISIQPEQKDIQGTGDSKDDQKDIIATNFEDSISQHRKKIEQESRIYNMQLNKLFDQYNSIHKNYISNPSLENILKLKSIVSQIQKKLEGIKGKIGDNSQTYIQGNSKYKIILQTFEDIINEKFTLLKKDFSTKFSEIYGYNTTFSSIKNFQTTPNESQIFTWKTSFPNQTNRQFKFNDIDSSRNNLKDFSQQYGLEIGKFGSNLCGCNNMNDYLQNINDSYNLANVKLETLKKIFVKQSKPVDINQPKLSAEKKPFQQPSIISPPTSSPAIYHESEQQNLVPNTSQSTGIIAQEKEIEVTIPKNESGTQSSQNTVVQQKLPVKQTYIDAKKFVSNPILDGYQELENSQDFLGTPIPEYYEKIEVDITRINRKIVDPNYFSKIDMPNFLKLRIPNFIKNSNQAYEILSQNGLDVKITLDYLLASAWKRGVIDDKNSIDPYGNQTFGYMKLTDQDIQIINDFFSSKNIFIKNFSPKTDQVDNIIGFMILIESYNSSIKKIYPKLDTQSNMLLALWLSEGDISKISCLKNVNKLPGNGTQNWDEFSKKIAGLILTSAPKYVEKNIQDTNIKYNTFEGLDSKPSILICETGDKKLNSDFIARGNRYIGQIIAMKKIFEKTF